ncbi:MULTISPECIES: DUF6415 family natural product biosynthesis protein [unclassified Streptomyces]|uniref:DUF6415 family natural product biosynthesis protein n=1 Tax=unclassified Streptomyces TaxID=2593676 RepID=UPI002259B78D|nr:MULTISPECIES: DUF6415 family natural product biosynthesis protein [unclassified Streptomyces]MCX4629232.1 DUF6415 family natural product biosynthesis protein [Streptomyces sp. NBC_01443]
MGQIPANTSGAEAMTVAEAALVARALVPYNLKPGDEEILVLLLDLTRHGERLRSDVVRLGKADVAAAAVEDWHTLTSRGPDNSPLGIWNHVRALARVVKAFRRAMEIST